MDSNLDIQPMSPSEFVAWLKGRFDRKRGEAFTKEELTEILDKLNMVQEPIDWNPFINPWEPITPDPILPVMPLTNRCSACGLELKRVMGYVCHNANCPTGLAGPTFSTTTEK
jgi:hypothetical protein